MQTFNQIVEKENCLGKIWQLKEQQLEKHTLEKKGNTDTDEKPINSCTKYAHDDYIE